jgi:hypothetical protein
MKKKKTTIEDLAVMVQKGFTGVDKRFDTIDERLDRIENMLIAEHRRRIEKLENEMRKVREILAVK